MFALMTDKPFIEIVPSKGTMLKCKQQVFVQPTEVYDIPEGCTKFRFVEEYSPEEDSYFLNVLFFAKVEETDEEFDKRMNEFNTRRLEALKKFKKLCQTIN